MKRFVLLLLLVGAGLIVQPAPASAHRSGCHRWHSCPSDTGSYVCGDLGYTSGCPRPVPTTTTTIAFNYFTPDAETASTGDDRYGWGGADRGAVAVLVSVCAPLLYGMRRYGQWRQKRES